MSYSFSTRSASKVQAKAHVAAGFAKVVNAQPCHSKDMRAALSAAEAFIDLLEDDLTKDVCINISGSLSYGADPTTQISNASVSVAAYLMTRA